MTPQTAQDRANVALHALGYNTYHDSVPLDKLCAAVEAEGWTIPGDERPILVCGREGRAVVPCWYLDPEKLAALDAVVRLIGAHEAPEVVPTHRALTFTWYRMPSGRYEIVAYLS